MAKTFDEVMELVSKTAEIAASNTASTEVILTELQKQRSLLTGLSSTVNGMEQSITDYKFDVDGKQTSYRYEVIETTTIDFDRNDVRGLAKKLQKECDNISSKLDLIELTTDVEFTPKWDVNDTLEEIITSTKQ